MAEIKATSAAASTTGLTHEPARQLDLPALIIDRDRNLFSEFGRLFGNGAHHSKRGREKDHDSEFAHCGSDLNRYAIGG